ncbi:MAG: phosphoenolpyruvate carboxykinase [Bacteroidetes bacterium]|nr:phosphoenolpyruvate carboxykinase [Bacteroidota bacterium]
MLGSDEGLQLLQRLGLRNLGNVYWNLSTPALYEESVRRREGWISHLGPLVVHTGHHTGRSPNDKFIVRDASNEQKIAWGKVNRAMDPARFDTLFAKLTAFFQGRDLFVQNLYGGADARYRIPVRIITDHAWHNLFARNLLLHSDEPIIHASPDTFTIIDSPRFHANPEMDGTNSEVFIVLNFAKRIGIIGGTTYAGEIKKSVFTVLNYLLPDMGVFPMHCSANVGTRGDVALFFGLSGTGKTTLSADPERLLIGDDEHGWSDTGIFNFEGGCYAKVIRLSPDAEPDIYRTTRMFGTVLENVIVNSSTRHIDLNDASLTENTRAAYPIGHIPKHVQSGMGGHPKNLIMLTADAFGVMPPISRLTPDQAMYHFLSGYTAKVAGTEKGVLEPQTTFSTCFGAPFMPLPPTVYARLLGERVAQHKVDVWLVNTGWTGGPYGVGNRMKIAFTRQMIHAILNGMLKDVPAMQDPIFGLHVPEQCQGVPREIMNQRDTWTDKHAYDTKAKELAAKFKENFKQFTDQVRPEVRDAGPK